MFSKFETLYHTIKHLKCRQIYYQLKYRLVKPRALMSYGTNHALSASAHRYLNFQRERPVEMCWDGGGGFRFLNIEVDFGDEIEWDFRRHGKLWNYNLQYANYLDQPEIPNDAKVRLMKSQYEWLSCGRLLLEPYPAALRSINMMRWISINTIKDEELLKYLYRDLNFLSTRLEYHLLGNHLLENAFALMMGGAFFSNEAWLNTGKKILKKELEEQTLSDGAHFELSPMYHQIIFFRVLELIGWYSDWKDKQPGFERFLRSKAADMWAWLQNISFKNGDIPHFNDSADGVAFSTRWLSRYASQLGITASNKILDESGYRAIARGAYELRIDFAQISPPYQPGHAHADALGFVLYYNGQPLFVEQGTSTYQPGRRRNLERSTQAHNTVVINGANQSQVWGGFRVAKRAKITITEDGHGGIYTAQHDGYKRYGILHQRTFIPKMTSLHIEDAIAENAKGTCYLHLYPNISIDDVRHNKIFLSNGVYIVFESPVRLLFEDYEFANGFNNYQEAKRIIIVFSGKLSTIISFDA